MSTYVPRLAFAGLIATLSSAGLYGLFHKDEQSTSPLRVEAAAAEVGSVPNGASDFTLLDRFQVDANSLARGSFSFPMDLTIPMDRVSVLANIFPTYSPDFGFSEWGRGWISPTFELVRRGRNAPPSYTDADPIESQWGVLLPGAGGRYALSGEPVAAQVSNDGTEVRVTEPNGTIWIYGGPGKTISASGRGTAVWMLSRVDSIDGDRLSVDEYLGAIDSDAANNTPGAFVRLYPLVISWSRVGRAQDGTETAVIVAKAAYKYDAVQTPIRDYSLGLARQLDQRISGIDFYLRSLDSEDFALAASYTVAFEIDRPWFLHSITETRGATARTETFEYGKSWEEHEEVAGADTGSASQPDMTTVDYAGESFFDPYNPSTPPGSFVLTLSPGDLDGDGISDFLGRRGSWYHYFPGGPGDQGGYEFLDSPRAGDPKCISDRVRPVPVMARAGAPRPNLLAFAPADDARTRLLSECTTDGVLSRSFKLKAPAVPACSAHLGPVLDPSDGSFAFALGDVDGDGTVDIVAFDNCTIAMWKGSVTPDGTFEPVGCTQDGECIAVSIPVPNLDPDPSANHYLLDVNGDGLADIVSERGPFIDVSMNQGTTPFAQVPFSKGSTLTANDMGAGCPHAFVEANGDPYIDMVSVCPDRVQLTVGFGSPKGITRQRTVSLADLPSLPKSLVAAQLGGMSNPGFAVVGEQIPAGEKTTCPAGTVKRSFATDVDSPTSYYCSSPIFWFGLRSADSDRLTDVDDGRGTHVRFQYDWERPVPGFPARSVLSGSIHSEVGTPDQLTTYTYDDNQWRDDSGQVGFATVTVAESSATNPQSQQQTTFTYSHDKGLVWVTSELDISANAMTRTATTHARSIGAFRGVPLVVDSGSQETLTYGRVSIPTATTAVEPNAAKPFCPSVVTRTTKAGTLTTRFTPEDLPTLGQALHCLTSDVERAGSHPDASLDFDYREHRHYTDRGQIDAITEMGGGNAVALEGIDYYPDGLAKQIRAAGKPVIDLTYKAAKPSASWVRTRLVDTRTESGGKRYTYGYGARDEQTGVKAEDGRRVAQSGTEYDDWSRPILAWNGEVAGPGHPYKTWEWHDPTVDAQARAFPGVVYETTRLQDASAQVRAVLLRPSMQPFAAFDLWAVNGAKSSWWLDGWTDTDPNLGTQYQIASGVIALAVPFEKATLDQLVLWLHVKDVESSAQTQKPLIHPILVKSVIRDPGGLDTTSLEFETTDPPPGASTGFTWRAWETFPKLQPDGSVELVEQSSTPWCNGPLALCSHIIRRRTLSGDGQLLGHDTTGGGAVSIDVDVLGRVRRVHTPRGETQRYDFDALGEPAVVHRDVPGSVGSHEESTFVNTLPTLTKWGNGSATPRGERLSYTSFGVAWQRTGLAGAGCFAGGAGYQCATDSVTWSYPKGEDGTELSQLPDSVSTTGYRAGFSWRDDGVLNTETFDLSPDLGSGSADVKPWRRIINDYARFDDGTIHSTTTTILNSDGATLWSQAVRMEPDSTGRIHQVFVGDHLFATITRTPDGPTLFGSTVYKLADGESLEVRNSDPLGRLGTFVLQQGQQVTVANLKRNTDGLVTAEDVFTSDRHYSYTYVYDHDATNPATTGLSAVHVAIGTDMLLDESYVYGPDGLLGRIDHQLKSDAIVRSPGTLTLGDHREVWTLDEYGRVLQHRNKKFTWGARNQISSVQDESGKTNFFYDENGMRVLSSTPSNSSDCNGANPNVVAGGSTNLDATTCAAKNLADVGGLRVSDDEIDQDLIIEGRTLGTFVVTRSPASGDFTNTVFHPAFYDEQGRILVQDGLSYPSFPFGSRATNAPVGRVPEFAGRRYDERTGMLRLGVRDYIAEVAQFASEDPLLWSNADACARDDQGCNLVEYPNDPVNASDPSGLLGIGVPRLSCDLCSGLSEDPAGPEGGPENNPFDESLPGSEMGDYAAKWYADKYEATRNPIWYTLGLFASLWTTETSRQTAAVLGLALGIDVTLGVTSPRDPNGPKPPGWDEDWSTRHAEGKSTKYEDKRYVDPEGGEWRFHEDDRHGPHWDYNPWDHATSQWENRDLTGNPILDDSHLKK